MSWLLNAVYLGLMLSASPWLIYAAVRHGKYRAGWAAKLFGRLPQLDAARGDCLWFHAVSVGEVNALATILGPLRTRLPGHQFVITTTTRTGYELACGKFRGDTVCYAPLDFSWAVKAAIQRIRPQAIVLIELELWPNLLLAAERARVPVAIVNGRLGASSFRGYRRVRRLLSPALDTIDLIAVQNEEYAKRFRDLGVSPEKVVVTGSVKFDGANSNRDNPTTRRLGDSARIAVQDRIFLAGSTQRGEEQVALRVFASLADEHANLRLVLVPRHPERFEEVGNLLGQQPYSWIRRSRLEGASDEELDNWRILLVDTVGELGAWWGTAEFAFVGGSLGSRGGQNMIEPAAYGAAVAFGPNTRNFRDVTELLLTNDAAVVVQDDAELRAFVTAGLNSPRRSRAMGDRAKSLVLAQRGATQHTVDWLTTLLSRQSGDHRRSDSQHAVTVSVRVPGQSPSTQRFSGSR